MQRHATAVVLAGGRSTRLGRDKAMLEFGGRPLLARVVDTASSLCDEVIVAGAWRRPEQWTGIDAVWVDDAAGIAGPLAGLRSGIKASTRPLCLAVACDMPFLSGPLLEHLIESIGDSDACVPRVNSTVQPLHAVYSTRILPIIDSFIRSGGRSLLGLLDRLNAAYLSEHDCAAFDASGLSTFSLNTREDVQFAVEEWARRTAGTPAA